MFFSILTSNWLLLVDSKEIEFHVFLWPGCKEESWHLGFVSHLGAVGFGVWP